eukprot:scaffold1531_cov296-Prasinococcus_capsulatus_cf.AAC.12
MADGAPHCGSGCMRAQRARDGARGACPSAAGVAPHVAGVRVALSDTWAATWGWRMAKLDLSSD